MQEASLIPVGKTGKSHGVSGAFKVFIDDRYLDDFLETELIFIEIEGRKLPFFIEDLYEANDLLVKLEEVNSPEAAHRYSGKQVFMRAEDLRPIEEEDTVVADQYERFIGYWICDAELGPLAPIEAVIELPQQFLASITFKKKEVLIPMHPELIQRIDHNKMQVWMNLPDGMLEV